MFQTSLKTYYIAAETSLLTIAAILAFHHQALAQIDGAGSVEEIVVTGSRIARADGAQAAPFVEVSAKEFTYSGTSNVEQLLNSFPQLVPGLTASSGSITEGDGSATADLRGLGAQRTLVLVNGRRWLFSDAQQIADLNTIPQALVERVEIVTGGSSAVYGSDAVSGVVNFVLKTDFEGFEASAKIGETVRGDGTELDFNILSGGNYADDRGNVVLSINYLKRNGIRAGARDFSRQGFLEVLDQSGQARLVPGGGSATVPEGRVSGFPTGAALADFPDLAGALQAAGLGGVGALGFIVDDGVPRPFQSPQDLFSIAQFDNIVIPQERWVASGFTDFDLTDRITAYAEATYSNNVVSIPIAPALLTQTIRIQTDNPLISQELRDLFAAIDAIDDTRGGIAGDGITALNFSRRMLESGNRVTRTERNAYKFTAGLRGDIGGLSDSAFKDIGFDGYYSFARTTNALSRQGVLSRSRFNQGILLNDEGTACLDPSGGCVPFNPFGANILSGDVIDFLSVNGAGGNSTSTLQVVAISLDGTLFDLPAGPLGLAVGGEWRKASSRFIPDDFTATGDVAGFSAAAPATAGSTEVYEGFAEVRIPLLKDLPFAQDVTANAAVRFSDYDIDGVGSVWTYSAGLEWVVSPEIALRGQFQRAIRAPSLLELFAPVSTGITVILDPCATPAAAADAGIRDTCIANGVPAALVGNSAIQTSTTLGTLIGGNPDLDAETADTFTAGASYTPNFAPGLGFKLDYYNIKLDDAIAGLAGGAANTVDLCFNVLQDASSAACRAINRDPLTGSIGGNGVGIDERNVNLSRIRASGIDIGIDYSFEVDWSLIADQSHFALSFVGSWLDRFTTTPVPDLPELKNRCAGTFGSICGEPKPEFKSTSRFSWQQGPLDLSLRWRLIGSVEDDRIVIGGRAPELVALQKISAQQYFDLTASWEIFEGLNLTSGILNLLDNAPPRTINVISGGSRLNTYDGLGARIFATLTARF